MAEQIDSAAAIDEQIRRQENDIESEIIESQPLVGDLEDWTSLELEYDNNPSFLSHIIDLGKKYRKVRRVRKDGNCFYRAFLFGYLEYLISRQKELREFRALIAKLAEEVVSVGYQPYIIQDMHEPFDELLKNIEEPNFSVATLSQLLNEQNYSNYYVAFLRVIVSYQLQKEEEFFQNFIALDQASNIRDFCTKEVEPMAKESDSVHIIALVRAFSVCLRVEYVDPRSQWQQDFAVDENGKEPVLTMLFKPGHYDIIYSS